MGFLARENNTLNMIRFISLLCKIKSQEIFFSFLIITQIETNSSVINFLTQILVISVAT